MMVLMYLQLVAIIVLQIEYYADRNMHLYDAQPPAIHPPHLRYFLVIIGFFAGYGFVMFSLIIAGASALRYFLKRGEDYYGDKAVDSELTESDQHGDDR